MYGLFGANIFGQSQITSSSFVGNNQYVKELLQPVPILNCINETGHLYAYNGSFENANYGGGNVFLQYNDNGYLITNDELRISFILVALGMDAYFSGIYYYTVAGTGLSLEIDQSQYDMTITVDNLLAYRNQGVNGANLYINVPYSNSNTLLTNINSSYAISALGGVYYSLFAPGPAASSWLFSCRDSMFQCDFVYQYGPSVFISLNIFSTNLYSNVSEIENCKFIGKGIFIDFNAEAVNAYIKDCSFINLYLNVALAVLYLDGNNTFLQSSIYGLFANISLDGNNTFLESSVYGVFANIYLDGNNTYLLSQMQVYDSSISSLAGNNTFIQSSIDGVFANISLDGNNTYLLSQMQVYDSLISSLAGNNTFIQSSIYGEFANISLDGNIMFQLSQMQVYDSSIASLAGNNTFIQSTINVQFANISLDGNNTYLQSPINVQSATISLAGNNIFSNNFMFGYGGAIFLGYANLLFASNSITTFIDNSAIYGGALYIDAWSMIEFSLPTNVSFINNTAFLAGGAIYAEPPYSNTCFYTLNCTALKGVHLYFEGNYANEAGSVLYGGNIDTCNVSSCMYSSTIVFDSIAIIGYHDPSTSLISSDSLCISSCNTSTNPVCLVPQNISIYPGQTPELTFATFGQRNGIVPTLIYVYLNTTYDILGTIRTLKECSSYSVPYEFNNGTNELVTETAASIESSFSVHITVLPCPILFVLGHSNNSPSCICDTVLERNNVICNISDVTVTNTGNLWIGLTSQGVPAFYSPCPFDYCTQNKTISVLDLDSQCSYNRSGVLCGQCQGNLSMTFGTSKCASCSNHFLLLIIVFIIMGLVLVVVVLVSNFTVSNGALNGIVLYVNLIRINDVIYFQSRGVYSTILSVIVAWLNLDLGIEVCFYNGMDSYAKTWLQFVFPISLIGVILVAGRYATSISKLFRFNAVPVLSTLVLLSYSKMLRTIINIFAYAYLDTMNSSSTHSLVWLYDGNVEYFGKEHLPMFVCGLLVTFLLIIPYFTLLLLAPCTQARSHWRFLQWVNNLKPFLDSYQAPFKDRYRFWPGILLFIRLPMYLVFILSNSTPVKMLTIIFCVIAYLLCAIGFSVYKNSSVLLVEGIFSANIVALSAVVLASSNTISPISEQSSEAIITTGITSAMLLLVVIVIHHRLAKIRLCVTSWRSVFANNEKAIPSLITSISNRSSSFEFHERSLGSF